MQPVHNHCRTCMLLWTAATLRMVERFLKNPGHEAVGLTMLGKTAEICVDKVLLITCIE